MHTCPVYTCACVNIWFGYCQRVLSLIETLMIETVQAVEWILLGLSVHSFTVLSLQVPLGELLESGGLTGRIQ